MQYGVSGPIARASGVDFDLRRDEPYLAYGELRRPAWSPGTEGDCLARFECLLEQVHVSLDLADACLDRLAELPPGPINQRLPKVLKVPEGHTYAWTENPLGINGYYLVSRGREDPVAAEAALRLVQQHPGAHRAAARQPGRRHDRDPGLDVLRRRRHRQVTAVPGRGLGGG